MQHITLKGAPHELHKFKVTFIDCSQPSIFSVFFLSLNPRIGSRENWTPAQKEDLNGWGVGIEVNRGAVNIFGKKVYSPFLQKRKISIG